MNISIKKWVNQLGMPLVTTEDKTLCFIVDTGATYNVLMRDSFDRCRNSFEELGVDDYLVSMMGEPKRISIVSGKINLGGNEYEDDFGLLDNNEGINYVRAVTGLSIDGALGVSFLSRYGISINFQNNTFTDE